MKSWKTTVAGVIAAVIPMMTQIQFFLDNDPNTSPDWEIVSSGIAVAAGFFFCRDKDVTSEQEGAK